MRTIVVPIVRRQVVAETRGQGVSRLSEAQRVEKGKADVRAIAHLLGDKPFFFGQPSSYDAIAYAFLANAFASPLPSPISDEARAREPGRILRADEEDLLGRLEGLSLAERHVATRRLNDHLDLGRSRYVGGL